MQCTLRSALRRKHEYCVSLYIEAVNALSGITVATEEWALAWGQAQHARKLCEDAHDEIKKHTAEHKC